MEDAPITVTLEESYAEFWVMGRTPFYFNTMSAKTKQMLLFPSGRRRSEADRMAAPKHDPMREFRDSMDMWADNAHPTRLKIPAPSFKGAMMTAALVLPGTKKTDISKLVSVQGSHVDFYGIPRLAMDVVRTADQNHTPDIRTRGKIEFWCCNVKIRYIRPNLNLKSVSVLLAASGRVAGVGDFRQEKGKGDHGLFDIVNADDPALLKLVKSAGRQQQDEALSSVQCYDADTQQLFDWYNEEVLRRGSDEPRKKKAAVAEEDAEDGLEHVNPPPKGARGRANGRATA